MGLVVHVVFMHYTHWDVIYRLFFLWQQEIRSVELVVWQCATFSFLITWRSSSSKSAAVYKISSKSDDFSLRYGDILIFKMAVVRHLGIVLPSYKTTHEVCCWLQLPVKFHVNLIHRSEDIYLFEFFAYLAWNAYSGPQNKFLGAKVSSWGTLDP